MGRSMAGGAKYILTQIRSTEADEAFGFHEAVATNSKHVWPRTEEQIRNLADAGCSFGVRLQGSRKLVALCYAMLDGDEQQTEDEHPGGNVWEIGGLTVASEHLQSGLGKTLARLVFNAHHGRGLTLRHGKVRPLPLLAMAT